MKAAALCVVLLAACGAHTARPIGTTNAAPVDRSVDAPPFSRFDLGSYFADSGRANRLADTLYQLTPDASTKIETLTLHLTPDRRISIMDISYGPMMRYAHAVATTRGRLGDPSTTHTDDDGSQYTTWQDARTRFELVGRVSNNRSAVHGRLTDLLLARP